MSKPSSLVLAPFLIILMLAPPAEGASEGVHWGYEGEAGPEHWGELSPDYAACSQGMEQSPVDIPATTPVNPPGLQFNYQPSALNIVNNGHAIQVNYDSGSSLVVDGAAYPLVQFHLHSLSEHTLNAAHTAMELHLVHKDAAGHTAVVGVMIVEGAQSPAYEPILANMPAEEGKPHQIDGVTVNAVDLLPADSGYYRYNGSLTTPPCTEGVKWFVMSVPVELSADRIASFQSIYDNNYRPVQPLNERTFLLTSTPPPAELPGTGAAIDLILLVAVGLVLLGSVLWQALYRQGGSATPVDGVAVQSNDR
jgi:carbonic anhydrase